MEGFRLFDAVFLAQLAIARHHEFLDVVAISGLVVVTQQRQLLALFGSSARSFGTGSLNRNRNAKCFSPTPEWTLNGLSIDPVRPFRWVKRG